METLDEYRAFAVYLSQELREARKKIEELEKKIRELLEGR